MYESTGTQEHNACARDQGEEDYAERKLSESDADQLL